MSELKICRICLRAQCKVFKYDRYQLKAYYEEVVAQKMYEKDGLPNYFCYECATILHNFHKFKEKCWTGQRLLKQIQSSGKQITYEAVHQIDRAHYNLQSPLEIITVTKRVRTYVTVEKAESSDTECERSDFEDEKEINIKDIENKNAQIICDDGSTFEDNYDSDCPMSYIKANMIEDQKPAFSYQGLGNEDTDKVDSKIETVEHIDTSIPKTVFVGVKKDTVELKREPIKGTKKSILERALTNRRKKVSPKFKPRKENILDKDNWKIYTLSEEEAVKDFQLRAENPKYKDAAFKCVDCFKGFSKEDMLKRHKQLRHSETLGKQECRFCHKRFKWEHKLRRHMVEHFNRYKCLLCGIVVCVPLTAELHNEWHKGATMKCQHCGEEFRHRSSYYTHLRTHRSVHVCVLCGVSFVSQAGLKMHRKIKHIEDCIIDDDDDDGPANTFCSKCDVRFETRKAYEKHIFHSAMHADEAFDDKNFSDELDDKSGEPKKILGKRTQEKILGKQTEKTLGNKIQGHKLTVLATDDDGRPLKMRRKGCIRRNKVKPTTCNQCGKHFATQMACMKHHHAEHPGTPFSNERHICEVCGASLAPGSIANHANIHSRQKEFPCETCGKKFHSLAGLKRHLVAHTGEKPFACTLCDKRFTQSNSMKLHYNTFHLKKPYPKRNRRKKKDELLEFQEKSSSESDASLPRTRRIEPVTSHGGDNHHTMHYLTLS